MTIFDFIQEIVKKYPGRVLFNVAASVVMSLLGVLSICSLTPIIDVFLYPDGKGQSSMTLKVISIFKMIGIPTSVPFLVAVFIILVMATAFFQVLINSLFLRSKFMLMKDIMFECFRDFFNARWLFFSSTEQGKIYSTFNRELGVLGEGFVLIGMMFSNIVQLVVFLIVPFYISWKITLICIGFGLAVTSMLLILSRLSYRLGKVSTDTANLWSSLVYENISGAKFVLGQGRAKEVTDKVCNTFDTYFNSMLKGQILNYSIAATNRPAAIMVVLIVLLVSRSFGVQVSEVAALLLALLQVVNVFCNFIAQRSAIANIIPGYEQIDGLRKRAREMKHVCGNLEFKTLSQEIVLEDVSFSYPGRGEVLSGINIRVPKAKTVAFVGKSGVGKSTLIDILMGFNEVTKGKVMIDGVPLSEYEINSYRHSVGYVPQDHVVFNMSIKDNLLWAKPQASPEQVLEACQLANADEFIRQFPQGYDTIVGDRGVRLSGGQVQRLSLARAFLRKPQVLFLDEATSSLDSHSEVLIQQAIETISGKTTVVVVAHRLSTIRRADIIYVLDKGRVVESGSYEELCRQGGFFLDLANLQELGIQA